MRTIVLELMFDGTAYHGFQRQHNGITVQETLESAILAITGTPSTVIGCSRTDAGVHAAHYVAMFETAARIGEAQFPKALNSALPADIRITHAHDAPADFHPIRSAVEKTYRYRIFNRRYMDVFLRNYAWFRPEALSLEAMQSASSHLVGEHDFSAFMAAGGSAKTTVRHVSSLTVTAQNGILDITVTANGFLYNMVRIIAGTLVYVGNGKLQPTDMPDILASKDRVRAGVTAPPQGLTLLCASYREEWLKGTKMA